jgi:REP element-mobilizing transposase RayT
MRLSPRGQIADEHWRAIPEHFSHGELGAYIVMPNHVHGIIVIHDRADADASARTGTQLRAPTWRAPTWLAPTWRAPTDNAERFGKPVKGSIPTIIRSYKASVTRRIQRELNGLDRPGPIWQRNYYERIIRDDEEYRRIHLYIEANVANWAKDRETR